MGLSHYSNNDKQDAKIDPVTQQQYNSVTNDQKVNVKELVSASGGTTPRKVEKLAENNEGPQTDRKPTMGLAKMEMLLGNKLNLNLM